MTKDTVTTWHLEMHDAGDHQKIALPNALSIIEARLKQFQVNRFLYSLVGKDYQWHDKLDWDDARWQKYAERDTLRTWIAYTQGSIAGYFELDLQEDKSVELAYFGLAPLSIGQGFGKAMLSHAIDSAWQWESPERVWLHTCSLDHPHALKNYQQRGFKIFKQECE